MPLTYPLVHELVIVIADLYLSEAPRLDVAGLPGVERVARFGSCAHLAEGWRVWVARTAGRAELAAAAPAAVAALCTAQSAPWLWLATPVHLALGVASLHLHQRGLLRLPPTTSRMLAEDFARVFHGSGYTLEALVSGGFLLGAAAASAAGTLEPARCVGADIGAALPESASLRRLGAEIEIWLHEHPVNLARSERGELEVSTLWLWGGGSRLTAAAHAGPATARDEFFYGSDPYLDGLGCARGARTQPLPRRLQDLLDKPARRIVMVVDLATQLADGGVQNEAAALALLDAQWISPAVGCVARGALRTLRVIANDRCLAYKRSDGLRVWRKRCRGLRGIV